MEADALALGEALGAGEASDFFPFAETLRGADSESGNANAADD